MQISRSTAVELGAVAAITAVAGALHNLGLREPAPGLFGTTIALAGAGAHAIFGHLGLRIFEKLSENPRSSDLGREGQNRAARRLIGEAIARILEREAERAQGGETGTKYLREAARSFRTKWLTVEMTGAHAALSEVNILRYFSGQAESIKTMAVLEHAEWITLVKEFAPTFVIREKEQALTYAVSKLRNEFASELWEGAVQAWRSSDTAWPDLVLRLLSVIAEQVATAQGGARQIEGLRQEIRVLSAAINRFEAGAPATVSTWDDAEGAESEDSTQFSQSIKTHMAQLHQRVEPLTEEQRHVIDYLKYFGRVRISGIAGSGKTLAAAQKAIRLATTERKTLLLCHNPRLKDYLASLTDKSGVTVAAFTQWVHKIAGLPTGDEDWSRYDEPTEEALGAAFNRLTSSSDRYDAVIVDEGQDFREEWWLLVQAALKDPESGILYIFHDDMQALLPCRASYPFNEPIVDLSRNCRNAGRVYELMCSLHRMAPQSDRELSKLGEVFAEFCNTGQEREAIGRAISWFPRTAREDLVVLFAGDAAFMESVFSDLSFSTGPDVHWQEEVRWMFAHAVSTRNTIIAPRLEVISERLNNLSDELRPITKDVLLVQETARMFTVQPEVRRRILTERMEGFVWQIKEGKAKLRSQQRDLNDIFSSEIIMHFETDTWNLGLPALNAIRFSREETRSAEVVPIRHISEFKGLEATAILLYIHRFDSMPDEELLVGISRARLMLALVVQNQAEKSIPQALRNKLHRRTERSRSRSAGQLI